MRPVQRLLLVPALALLLAAHGGAPLALPDTIALPQFTDTQKLSDAIVTALTNRKWLVEKDTGESITAHLDVRRHRLRLRIDYTPREISFHYVDSDELGYEVKDNAALIHPKANLWLKALGDEVHLQVQPFAFARDPATVIPVTPAESPAAESAAGSSDAAAPPSAAPAATPAASTPATAPPAATPAAPSAATPAAQGGDG